MRREGFVFAAIIHLSIAAFFVDEFITPDVLLPAAPYVLPIILAALLLSPRATAVIGVVSVALHSLASLLHVGQEPWLAGLYVLGTLLSGCLGVALAYKMRREITLLTSVQARNEKLAAQNEELHAQGEELAAQAEELRGLSQELFEQRERAGQLAQEAQKTASTLRTLVDSMPDEVWACDAQANMSMLSAQALPGIGLKLASEKHEPLAELAAELEIYRPDGTLRPVEEAPLFRSLKGERLQGEEMFRHLKSGELRYRQYSSAPIRNDAGQIIGAVAIARDITEQREAQRERERLIQQVADREATLRAEQKSAVEREKLLAEVEAARDRFRRVVENAPCGIAVFRGPDFVFEVVNAAYQAFAPGKHMPCRDFAEVWPEIVEEVGPIFKRVLETGEPYSVMDAHIPVQRKPGGPLEDAFWTYSLQRLPPDESGRLGILNTAIETTQQVRDRQKIEQLAEVAQRHAAELQAVIDNMVDAVFVCDAQAKITIVNEAGVDVLGLASADEVRRQLSEFPDLLRIRRLDGRALSAADLPMARALTGKVIAQEEEILYNPRRGQDRYVRTSASPIRDESDTIVGAVAVVRDVTELIELDKMKDGFIAVAAHELKTPVAIMKGYSQAPLRLAEGVSERQRKMLQAIDRGTNRIDGVVQELLDISKLYIGRLELELERVDLSTLIAEVVERVTLTAPKHLLRFREPGPVFVQADRGRLEQVVVNLVDNAIKYSPTGGAIDLSLEVDKHRAIVSVADCGVGIPKEKQRHIFQRFYRAHDRTPNDYGGMGVGLYISKEIVTRRDGQMWFASEESKGSTFYFSLPLLE